MTLLAAHPRVGGSVKNVLTHFTKLWGDGGFDLIVIASEKGTGPRAAKKIREALEVDD